MNHLSDMKYDDDFIVANRILTYENEIKILKERQKKPKSYPDPQERINYLTELIEIEKSKLKGAAQ